MPIFAFCLAPLARGKNVLVGIASVLEEHALGPGTVALFHGLVWLGCIVVALIARHRKFAVSKSIWRLKNGR
jgi:hypothetical protein